MRRRALRTRIGVTLFLVLGIAAPVHGQACIEDVRALMDRDVWVRAIHTMTPNGQGYAGAGTLPDQTEIAFLWSADVGFRTTAGSARVVGSSEAGEFVILSSGSGSWRRWETETGTVVSLAHPDSVSNMEMVRVSADGTIFARGLHSEERNWYPWRWTPSSGYVRLRDEPLYLTGVSHDDRVRVGYSLDPMIWRASVGTWEVMDGFPEEDELRAFVNGLSGDGEYATGWYTYSLDEETSYQAVFRWKDDDVETIPGTDGQTLSTRQTVTDDGTILADWAQPPSYEQTQVLWSTGEPRSIDDVVADAGFDPELQPHALGIEPRISIDDKGTTLFSNAQRAIRLSGGCTPGLRGYFNPGAYTGGSDIFVQWIASGIEGDVTVEFSPDGEAYETLGAAPAYPRVDAAGNVLGGLLWWTVPHVNSSNAHLRLTASGSEEILGPFTVRTDVETCPEPPVYTWTGQGAGFSTADNWDPEGPPGESDLARFEQDTFVPVSLFETATAGAMEILAGRVSIDTEGWDLNLTDDRPCVPNLLVDNGAELSIRHGNLWSEEDALISSGTVRLSERANLLTRTLLVAESGDAEIEAASPSGLRVDSLLQAALSPDVTAEISFHGTAPDSTALLLPLRAEIGVRGTAALTVSGRATVVGPLLLDPGDRPLEIYLGVEPGAHGTMTLSGSDVRVFRPDDDVDRTTSMVVGSAGTGSLHLFDGVLIRLDTLTIAHSGAGTVRIDSTTAIQVDHQLRMGVVNGAEAMLEMDGSDAAGGPGAGMLLAERADIGIGGTATVRLTGTSFITDGFVEGDADFEIAMGTAATGEGGLIASGPSVELFLSKSSVVVGEDGTGIFTLSDRADARVETMKIASGSGSGTATIEGGSMLKVEAEPDAGYLGELQMGGTEESEASLIIRGTAENGLPSTLTLDGYAQVGQYGTATVSVEEGGEFKTDIHDMVLGAFEGGEGTLRVADEGSTFDMLGGNLVIGGDGKGDLQVTSGGRVDVDALWIGKGSTGYGSAFAGGTATTVLSNRLAVGTGAFGLLQVADGAFVQTDLIWIGENGGVEGDVLAVGAYTPPSKTGAQEHGLAADTLVVSAGAKLTVDSLSFGEGAVLGGSGTFPVDFVNAGTVAPGDSADVAASAGRFTIDAAYVQSANGILAIDLGGPSPGSGHDQLQVTGIATLDGTLRLALIDDYVPTSGDVFEILTASGVEGAFANVIEPDGVEIAIGYESARVLATVGEVTVAVEDPPDVVPGAFALEANYPNPFNPQTTIPFVLPEVSHVRLEVFDALGRRVGVLVDGVRAAGRHEAVHDAGMLPSGIYIYRLEAGGFRAARRMLLVR